MINFFFFFLLVTWLFRDGNVSLIALPLCPTVACRVDQQLTGTTEFPYSPDTDLQCCSVLPTTHSSFKNSFINAYWFRKVCKDVLFSRNKQFLGKLTILLHVWISHKTTVQISWSCSIVCVQRLPALLCVSLYVRRYDELAALSMLCLILV